jgi:hypothetical protein
MPIKSTAPRYARRENIELKLNCISSLFGMKSRPKIINI